MKNTGLFVAGLWLFAFWMPASCVGQLSGTGYPTSMGPWTCPQPLCEPAMEVQKHPASKSTGARTDKVSSVKIPSRAKLTDASTRTSRDHPIVARVRSTTPQMMPPPVAAMPTPRVWLKKNSNPYEMYFEIPIAVLQNGGCDGKFQVGFDFKGPGPAVDADRDSIGPSGFPYYYQPNSTGMIQSFEVFVQSATGPVPELALTLAPPLYSHTFFGYDPEGARLLAPVSLSSQRYPLPPDALSSFAPGNTLVLHATGFSNIFVGVWCANSK
ncbi:MAG TPA: hypothetical protein VNW97_19230 [Candidatus Saccharimonadales bacterium]|nr:hypothetical protein [Candidatus Saccharimonadales bacterium]